ncbi:MAG TPA: hypothetical protein VMY69_07840, partial [Phycisphaerae bacterium]|nr:hypothetical protein [Phycisphaerae bacterium]
MNEAQAVQPIGGALAGLDVAVLAFLLLAMLVIAYWSGRREKDTGDFFLGGRRVPALVACL